MSKMLSSPPEEAETAADPIQQARTRLKNAMRLHGHDSMQALEAGHQVALAHLALGQMDAAVAMLTGLLWRCRHILGENHPDTLVVAGNLAVVRFSGSPSDTTVAAIDSHVRLRGAVLGPSHPMTLTAAEALASALRENGQATEAVGLAKKVVSLRAAVLGSQHPDTLISRLGLALASLDLDLVDRAVEELEAIDRDAPPQAPEARAVAAVARRHLAACRDLLDRCAPATQAHDRGVVRSGALSGTDDPWLTAPQRAAATSAARHPGGMVGSSRRRTAATGRHRTTSGAGVSPSAPPGTYPTPGGSGRRIDGIGGWSRGW